MYTTSEVQQIIARDKAAKLIKSIDSGSFFSVIEFDELSNLTGRRVSAEDRDVLHDLHCKYYNDMDPEVREWLQGRLEFISPGQPPTPGRYRLPRRNWRSDLCRVLLFLHIIKPQPARSTNDDD